MDTNEGGLTKTPDEQQASQNTVQWLSCEIAAMSERDELVIKRQTVHKKEGHMTEMRVLFLLIFFSKINQFAHGFGSVVR